MLRRNISLHSRATRNKYNAHKIFVERGFCVILCNKYLKNFLTYSISIKNCFLQFASRANIKNVLISVSFLNLYVVFSLLHCVSIIFLHLPVVKSEWPTFAQLTVCINGASPPACVCQTQDPRKFPHRLFPLSDCAYIGDPRNNVRYKHTCV